MCRSRSEVKITGSVEVPLTTSVAPYDTRASPASAAGVPVFPSHAVVWPEYAPRGPQPVTGAMLEVSNDRHGSVELTDVTVLARISLAERKKTLIAKEIGKTVANELLDAGERERKTHDVGGAEWRGAERDGPEGQRCGQ